MLGIDIPQAGLLYSIEDPIRKINLSVSANIYTIVLPARISYTPQPKPRIHAARNAYHLACIKLEHHSLGYFFETIGTNRKMARPRS